MKYLSDKKDYRTERRFRLALAVLIALLFVILAWQGRDLIRLPTPGTIVLYGFSIMEEVMREGIFPAFQETWQTRTGEHVELVAAFAGSGAITGKIIRRFPAEVAILSSKIDVIHLMEAHVLWQSSWDHLPHEGVVVRTPFIIVVREGNPRGITDFADLMREGVVVVQADPTTSGGGQWSILAEYGSALRETGNRDLAWEQLRGIWKNVAAPQAPSAREARRRFASGTGDALVTYEQDAIGNPARAPVVGELVYPPRTIISEPTLVKIDRNVAEDQRDLVDGFVEFLWSRQAQQIFVEYGFRSPLEELNQANAKLGMIEDPFTWESLGGARQAERTILKDLWRDRIKAARMTDPEHAGSAGF